MRVKNAQTDAALILFLMKGCEEAMDSPILVNIIGYGTIPDPTFASNTTQFCELEIRCNYAGLYQFSTNRQVLLSILSI